jgi:hypothetical protein
LTGALFRSAITLRGRSSALDYRNSAPVNVAPSRGFSLRYDLWKPYLLCALSTTRWGASAGTLALRGMGTLKPVRDAMRSSA